MGNCLARICPVGPDHVLAPAAVEMVVQTEPEPVRPPSPPPMPTVPVLSASAQARWRQVCNQPLRNQLDARQLLSPGARLELSFEERAGIAGALAELPQGADFWSAVATACNLGNPVKFGAVETLIRHGVLDPNFVAGGSSMLQSVCRHGQSAWPTIVNPLTLEQRIASLIARGARIETPALAAIDLLQQTWERGDADGHLAALALIANGCDPLQRDTRQRMLLHRAAEEGNMPVLRGWHQARLAMDLTVNHMGYTALHLAARHGHHEAVRFLITEGDININARTVQSQTALHYAVTHSHVEAARILLELQASVEVADRTGQTPLIAAVLNRSEPLRTLLMQHGADPYATYPRRLRSAASLYEQLHDQPWPDAH